MELGATGLHPATPLCLVCPVAAECRARALGLQDALPVRAAKPPPLEVTEACALVVRGGRLLIVQRGPGRLWEGFWEFPTIHLAGADPAGRSLGEPVDLAEGVRRLTGIRARIGPAVRTVRFGVTRHRVALTAHAAVGLAGRLRPGPGLARASWATPEDLAAYPFGSAGRRLAAWAAQAWAAGSGLRAGSGVSPDRARDHRAGSRPAILYSVVFGLVCPGPRPVAASSSATLHPPDRALEWVSWRTARAPGFPRIGGRTSDGRHLDRVGIVGSRLAVVATPTSVAKTHPSARPPSLSCNDLR